MNIIVGQTNTALASLTTSINSNIAALGPKFASPIYSRDNSEPSAFPTFAIWTNQNNEARATTQEEINLIERYSNF